MRLCPTSKLILPSFLFSMLLSFYSCASGYEKSGVGDVTFFSSPSPLAHAPVIDAINQAKTSLRMKMFHLSDQAVIDALIQSQQRNVKVQIILDAVTLDKPNNQKRFDALKAAGIDVRKSSLLFNITHEKTMIIDNNKAFITTMNLTSAYDYFLDFGLIVTHPPIIAEMNLVFDADLKNADQGTNETPALTEEHLLWSPVSSEQKLIGLIDSAANTLDFTVENLGNNETALIDAFKRAASRNVKIRAILPACSKSGALFNAPAIKELIANHADIRLMPEPSTAEKPYIHAKMIRVDQALLYVGSINFSVNSVQYARELGIILNDQKVATALSEQFTKLWPLATTPKEDGVTSDSFCF